jgi:hypothetical protein
MGKAMILEHLGGGQYRIGYYRDVGWAKKRQAELAKVIYDTQIERLALSNTRDALLPAFNAAQSDYLDALADWAECAANPACPLPSVESEMNARAQTLIEIQSQIMALQSQISTLQATSVAASEETGWLASNAPESEELTVWAIDYPPKVGGVYTPIPAGTIVGTVETYGVRQASANSGVYFPDEHVNVQSHASPAYNATRDRRVIPFASMGVGTAAMNLLQFRNAIVNNPARLAGKVIQRHAKTNTLDVRTYFDTPSTGPIYGQTPVELTDVPVDYAACPGFVFFPGEWVIVEFLGVARAEPRVIGFAQNPRPCEKVTVTYTVDPGGIIIGQNPQEIPIGGNGYPVMVGVCSDEMGFEKWSDNSTDIVRTETNVTSPTTIHATLQTITVLPIGFPSAITMGYTGSSSNDANEIFQSRQTQIGNNTAITGGHLIYEGNYPGSQSVQDLGSNGTITTYTWTGQTSSENPAHFAVPVLRGDINLCYNFPETSIFDDPDDPNVGYSAISDLSFESNAGYGWNSEGDDGFWVKAIKETYNDTSVGKSQFQQEMFCLYNQPTPGTLVTTRARAVKTNVTFSTKVDPVTGATETVCTGTAIVYDVTPGRASWCAYYQPAMLEVPLAFLLPKYETLVAVRGDGLSQIYGGEYKNENPDPDVPKGHYCVVQYKSACSRPRTLVQKIYSVVGY